jgi:hypothetical protein
MASANANSKAMASANANSKAMQCSTCGKHATAYRCIACNKASVKICRAFTKVAPEVKAGLQGMLHDGQLDKVQFYADAAKFFGADLEQLFTNKYAEVCEASKTLEFVGTGLFYDEDDIKEKYKNKQQRLDGILKNATRIICPVTGSR